MATRRILTPLFFVLFGSTLFAQEFDVVIRHARLIDGTGAKAHAGDIAVRGGFIARMGDFPGRGKMEIDARGQVVAPGFIDVHTHADDIAELPIAENFIRMGVTTVVTGNCGSSPLEVGTFFEEIVRVGVTLNVATLIGQNTVRSQVMGGSFMRPPTAEEREKMRQLVSRAMQEGAVGLSTGLIYLPGTYSKTDEIVDLAKVAAAAGGIYASHMRHENSQILDALAELTQIAREARIPAHVSHIKLSGPQAWGRADEVIGFIAKARAEGLEVTQDQYAYTASSTGIATLVPSEVREGGTKKFIERLTDPAQRKAMIAGMKDSLARSQRTDFGYAVIASFKADPRLNGKTVVEAARIVRGADTIEDQIEVVLDIVARGGANGVFHTMNEDDLRKFLGQPLTMIASDSGVRKFRDGVPHPRGYGNNARILARYVRELKLLTLEDAVRRMTSLPARTFHLKQRGELRPGFVADLVVFDPESVEAPATFDDPHHYAVGFSEVLVNGTPVIRASELTPARPGRPVKLNE